MEPKRVNRIVWTNKILTGVGYLAYPLLIVLLIIFEPELATRDIVVPASGFLAVSIMRSLVNAPRPYENGGPAPLIDKQTKGRSFPSRHTFCMFMIALTWFTWQPLIGNIVGSVLLICAVILAICRVKLRVHFPHDVVFAALLAFLFALVGYIVL